VKCYICESELNSNNQTEEHIIINAAGGRLKSKDLICIKCNISLGEKIDSALANQINGLANILMIKRHRGEPQPLIGQKKSTGQKYKINYGGKPELHNPIIVESTEGNTTNISITARNAKEMRNILSGYLKKHPNFNVDEAMKSAKWLKESFKEPLNFQTEIGGVEVFKAVCKCAINFFIFNKGNHMHIKHLIPYIKSEREMDDVVWFHYQDNLYELLPDESSHVLHLVGDPKEAILYCYVDYFNTYKYLVLLNQEYNGPNIKETYYYDLINTQINTREIRVNYDRKTLLSFFKNKDAEPFEKVKESLGHSIKLGLKRQSEFQRELVITKAIQNTLKKHSSATMLTKEIFEETMSEILDNLPPILQKELLD